MNSEILRVADGVGDPLDAHVSLRKAGDDDWACLTFESQGAGRNKDYFEAYDLVLQRLAALSATLLDGLVVSGDTKNLPLEARRFKVGDETYPCALAPEVDARAIARLLRRSAAAVGRKQGAGGPGNRAKRVEIRFAIAGLRNRPRLWLVEQLIQPGGALIRDAVLVASRRSGEDFSTTHMQDAASRRAVELLAMHAVTVELRKSWDDVVDVSATESFDLLCSGAGRTLHVEVKGTTSDGASIVLTRNEVAHARERYPDVALYVVSRIDLRLVEGKPVASGGTLSRYEPWAVDDFDMVPLSFQCRLPRS